MKPSLGQQDISYRISVVIRCVIAIVGSYTLALACNLFLALYLPLSKAEAVITANMLSIIIFCLVICWLFSVGSNTKAFIFVLIPSICLFSLVFLRI